MGVIDIRRASEVRGNIGNVKMSVRPDTASMYKQYASHIGQLAAQTGGLASSIGGLASHIGALGRQRAAAIGSLTGLGNTAMNAAFTLMDRDRKRREDDFTSEYEEMINSYMLGNGTAENRGKLNESFVDPADWQKEMQDKRQEIVKALKEKHGITDREWNDDIEHKIFSFDQSWGQRVIGKTREVMDGRAVFAAEKRTETSHGNFINGTETSTDWMKAINNEIEVRAGIDPKWQDVAVQENFRRQKAQDYVDKNFKMGLSILKTETANDEDAKSVGEKFDSRYEYLKGDDGKIDFEVFAKDPLVKAALGEDGMKYLQGNEKVYQSLFTEAKKTAMHNAQYLFRQNAYQSKKDAQDAENNMMKSWDLAEQSGVPFTDSQKADAFRNLVKINSNDYQGTDGAAYRMEKYDPTGYRYYQAKVDFYERRQKAEDAKAKKSFDKAVETDWDNAALDYLVMPKADLTAEEREKWLDDRRHFRTEFYNAFKRGEISREVASRVEGLMEKHFTEEQEDAVVHMLGRFGINVGLGQRFGTVGAAVTDLKTKENGETPAVLGIEKGWLWDSEKRMGTEDLGKYISQFAYLLDKMPKGADLKQYAIDCEDKIVSMYLDDQPLEDIMDAINIEFTRTKSDEEAKQKSAVRDVKYLNLNKGNK